MKRTKIGLVASLVLGVLGFSSSMAHATVTCATTTTTGFPKNQYWYCDPNPTNNSVSADAVAHVGSDAILKLQKTGETHLFFVFATAADYYNYTHQGANPTPTPPYSAPPANAQGYTLLQGANGYSFTFNNENGSSLAQPANSMAHEVGHQLDEIYSNTSGIGGYVFTSSEETRYSQFMTGMRVEIGGTLQAGETINLVFSSTDWAVNDANHIASHLITSTDTFQSIASALSAAINSKTTYLGAKGITASVSGTTITITSNYPVTAALQVFPVTGLSSTKSPTNGSTNATVHLGDLPALNATTDPVCTTSGSGIFGTEKDVAGNWICATDEVVEINGTPNTNDIITITMHNTLLSGGQVAVPYTVKSTDTDTTKIAAGIVSAINAASGSLIKPTIRIIAEPNTANDFRIASSGGSTTTTYTATVSTTGHETVSLSPGSPGSSTQLNVPYFGMQNAKVLMTAWPYFYTKSSYVDGMSITRWRWAENFAETVAVQSGYEISVPSPDYWIPNYLTCTKTLVTNLKGGLTLPTTCN